MFLVKQIKPKRFKDKEFNRIFRNRLKRVGRELIRIDFEPTVRTWDHDVKFKMRTHLTERTPSPSVEIYTDDEVWNWLDQGTKPHEIWAGAYTGKSKKKTLAFPTAFAPKTQPRMLASMPGQSGGPMAFTPYVEHPGTTAREWTKTSAKVRKPWFKKQMQEGLHEANVAGGHKI